ncbi:tyrosine-protein phosphatase [Kitasatospora sp. GP82]|uniref:tyrosine-protein phosphatase n=1 Tax=Kitasatospora sp. GP82 TaxID=3035089 RepID=UPI0024739DE7|nr:tyrosine-protein phosphatase [Kitasatospora sp. GP82]MDH6130459.1 protein-tyrosine phosphatase [Kitasatospora sp. GP82]
MSLRDSDAASPFLDIPGIRNLRDAAVGPIRPGLVYRSGSLNSLTPEGAQRLKALGIRSVVDLRGATELEHWPNHLHGLDLTVRHFPVLPEHRPGERLWPEEQADLYPFMAESAGPALAATVRHLIGSGALPVLLHCAVGKDRTGLTIAVLQHLLGAAEADITADFVRSNAGLGLLDGPTPYLDETGAERLSRPVAAAHLTDALRWIRTRHGGIESYLGAHGITSADLATLRTTLNH